MLEKCSNANNMYYDGVRFACLSVKYRISDKIYPPRHKTPTKLYSDV